MIACLAQGTAKADVTSYGLDHGSPALEIALPSLDHGTQNLAALHGKVVLVHFFATWCEPCRDEMAGLSRLSTRMGNRPFALVAVDVGEVPLRVRRFFDKQPVPFPILIDEDRATMKAWKVGAFPTTYLLDRSHHVQAYADGPIDWDHPQADRALETLISGKGDIPSTGLALPALQIENNGSTQ